MRLELNLEAAPNEMEGKNAACSTPSHVMAEEESLDDIKMKIIKVEIVFFFPSKVN